MKQKFKPSENRLKSTLSIQTHSYEYKQACEFIIRELSNMPGVVYSKDEHDNFYATKGSVKPDEFYPCIVAHHDTVHKVVEDKTIHKSRGHFYAFNHSNMEQVGTGGDDLVGVWAALEILRHQPVCKVAFFSQEEIGCVGSGKADMTFFKDVGYVFQTDRKGNDDFVTSIGGIELSSKEFQDNIKPVLTKHGYKCTSGGLTDVKTLTTKGIGVCTANMSSGYYRPHTSSEVVSIKDAKNVCSMMNNLVNHLGLTKWEKEYVAPTYNTYGTANDWYSSSWGGYNNRFRTYPYQERVGGNTWQRSPKVKNKTEKKADKIRTLVNKGFEKLNINELKSLCDHIKFYVKATHNVDTWIEALEKIMGYHVNIYHELGLYCPQCGSDSLSETDYIDGQHFYQTKNIAGADELKELYCMSCGTLHSIEDHIKDRITVLKASKKSSDTQLLLDYHKSNSKVKKHD